mgnify:CR=1 FL=1
METTSRHHVESGSLIVETLLSRFDMDGPHMQELILRETARHVADHIIAHHLPEILEKISPDAIANMSIAEAGAAVNETLHKKMPDKILEIERRSSPHIYKKGIFGGLKRMGLIYLASHYLNPIV